MVVESRRLPTVSVILPVRNEGTEFASTLERLLGQDYPTDRMEILIVDGCSNDGTRDVAKEFAARDPRIRLLENRLRIVPPAMNIGIRAARGEIIVRVDGHTRIAPDFVRRNVEALLASGASCVGGRMDPVAEGFVGRLVAAATSGPFGVGNSHFHYSDQARCTDSVYLGAWPRDVLLQVGGFDEEMVRDQDDELNYRIRAGGGKVWLDPAIRSEYTPRGDFRRLWKQYYQYGYWKVRVFQKHPTMMRWRHFVPSLAVACGVASCVAAAFVPGGVWLLVGGVTLYAGAAWLAAFLARATLVEKLAMPSVFFTLHVAYGSGFLVGLVRFLPRWFKDRPWPGLGAGLRSTGAEENEP